VAVRDSVAYGGCDVVGSDGEARCTRDKDQEREIEVHPWFERRLATLDEPVRQVRGVACIPILE
jgi:hypothetical protein